MQLFGCVFFLSLSIGRWRVHITPRPFFLLICTQCIALFFFSSPKNVYSLFLLFTGFIEYFRVGPPIWHQKKNRDCAGHREKISARYTNLYTYSDGTAAGRLDMHARFNNWTKKKSFFYFGHFLFLFFFSCSFGLIFFVFLIDTFPPPPLPCISSRYISYRFLENEKEEKWWCWEYIKSNVYLPLLLLLLDK
jgi:hypothetical protein